MKKIKAKVSHSLKFIIIESSSSDDIDDENAIFWQNLMKNSISDNDLMNRQTKIAVNKCCIISFTAGTSEWPQKGVMLSHDNIIWSTYSLLNDLEAQVNTEHLLSFHPLGSIMTQIFEIWFPLISQVMHILYFFLVHIVKGIKSVKMYS